MTVLVMMALLNRIEQRDMDLDFDGHFEYFVLVRHLENPMNCSTSVIKLVS